MVKRLLIKLAHWILTRYNAWPVLRIEYVDFPQLTLETTPIESPAPSVTYTSRTATNAFRKC